MFTDIIWGKGGVRLNLSRWVLEKGELARIGHSLHLTKETISYKIKNTTKLKSRIFLRKNSFKIEEITKKVDEQHKKSRSESRGRFMVPLL